MSKGRGEACREYREGSLSVWVRYEGGRRLDPTESGWVGYQNWAHWRRTRKEGWR
jgi:hypothetical protein